MDLCFVPMVISSFGVLHDDLHPADLGLAGQYTVDEDETKAQVNPSEVRDRATHNDPATSMRLVGIPGAVHYIRPPRRLYNPSDPTFRTFTAVNGLPLGAFPLGGEAKV
eukprot:CAMPEP_0174916996 /NCGR_PEP_ID=MMETSP1355-20121228/2197_1 /TAXON_ID=464990 /ORGANISM="Hemiselmis tepida, Strain CCMP443" /LENGTH=108 /DNA_ID=CAMNT_0016162059 /DNA_START=112 /DNA_END=440 /DNA_ORIENTATION=+